MHQQFVYFCIVSVAIAGKDFATSSNATVNKTELSNVNFEDLVNATIEVVRPAIPDPLIINLQIEDQLPNNDLIKGNIKVFNVSLKGTKDFVVSSLNFSSGMVLNYNFTFPHLGVIINYKIDSLILHFLPFYGEGKIKIQLESLTLAGNLTINSNIKNFIYLKEFWIKIGLGYIQFEIEGVMHDEKASKGLTWLFNKLLSTFIVSFISENEENITIMISPIVKNIINHILKTGNSTIHTILEDMLDDIAKFEGNA